MDSNKEPGPSESGIAKFIVRKEPKYIDGVITQSDELDQLEETVKEESEAEK